MQFIAAILMLSLSVGVLYWVWRRIGLAGIGRVLAALALGVLGVLTIRTAWIFAYVNFDYPSEFLVYAHSTPDVREVMEQIEDISQRTSGARSLDIAFTGDGSYPVMWYLRNYPNAAQLPKSPSRRDLDKSVVIAGDAEWAGIQPYLGENYVCEKYNFIWWPLLDYWDLTWDRVRYAITNPEMRGAMWDIIFRRDYRNYEQASGKTRNLADWPYRESFHFCVRHDVPAQVWKERAGPVELVFQADEESTRLTDYADLEQPAVAELEITDLGSFGSLRSPHGLARDADGFLYVADTDNHRIVKLSPEGQVIETWGSTWWHDLQSYKPGCVGAGDRPLALAEGEFCEPWGIAVGPDGKVYVADTWNHRIQVFTPDGQFLAQVGSSGQSGSAVLSAPGQFFGPRDITVDPQGRIFVSDTGNKRVQVFDANLNHLYSFGGPGIGEGQLDEPVGLAIGPDRLLYVADTWNQRVQAFTLAGVFVRESPIAGWQDPSTASKPYIATDSTGRVYVSDPEGSQIIISDAQGTPLAALKGTGNSALQLPGGVVLDAQDRIWISDAANHRLLRFPALNLAQTQGQ
jgi:DNA-binding beta-propeller fold protein YncE